MDLTNRKYKALIVKDEKTAKTFEELMNTKWKIVTTAQVGEGVLFLLTDK